MTLPDIIPSTPVVVPEVPAVAGATCNKMWQLSKLDTAPIVGGDATSVIRLVPYSVDGSGNLTVSPNIVEFTAANLLSKAAVRPNLANAIGASLIAMVEEGQIQGRLQSTPMFLGTLDVIQGSGVSLYFNLGQPANALIRAGGGPLPDISVVDPTQLPSGITAVAAAAGPATMTLSGTPGVSGTYPVGIVATNTNGSTPQTLNIMVF